MKKWKLEKEKEFKKTNKRKKIKALIRSGCKKDK